MHKSQKLTQDIRHLKHTFLRLSEVIFELKILFLDYLRLQNGLQSCINTAFQLRLVVGLPDDVEQSGFLGLHELEGFVSELLLHVFLFEVEKEVGEFALGTHHEAGEHDVPVIEQDFAVVLQQVSHCQVSMYLNLLIGI